MTNPNGLAATVRRRRFNNVLTWVGGADRAVLATAPTNRGSFVQMGLVVLATAGLGVLSMSFALNNGLHLPVSMAVLGGLVWGCVIAVIDRFLVMSLNLRGSVLKAAAVIGVRVCIAALLGIIISTPLVLQIFQGEIAAQISANNLKASVSSGKTIGDTPVAQQLNQVKSKISDDENALRGVLPAADSPEVKSRQDYLDKARQTYNTARDLADQKYRAWQCELYGSSCEGSTNVPGNGDLAQARGKEYQNAQQQADDASRAVTQAEADLTAARNSASSQNQAAVKKAQDAANAELPTLRQQEAHLQAELDGTVDKVTATNGDNTGLLAQIQALGDLGDNNGSAAMAHYAVAGLLFMIELLPVLVKVLTSLGPPSAYERNREAAEDTDVENAKIEKRRKARERDEDERRAVEEVKKEGAVVDDMRSRERDLGIKANERVAKEMEKVLDVALAQWALDVRKTLHNAAGVANGAMTPGSRPTGLGTNGTPRHSPHPAAGGQSVRSKFNLPNGKNLGSTTGSTP